MPKFIPAFSPNEPDTALLDLLDLFARVCLTAVEVVALISSCGWLIFRFGDLLQSSGDLMGPLDVLCALTAAFSFQLSLPGRGPHLQRLGFFLACFLTVLAASNCAARFVPIYLHPNLHPNLEWIANFKPGPGQSGSAFVALAFTLLGGAMALIQSQRRLAARVADALLVPLCFLALVLVSGSIFRFIESPRPLSANTTAPETLFCIALLAVVAVLRHVQSSLFAVFLGRGIAGRIARFAAPILIFLPFLREASRIAFIESGRIPPAFSSAILASIASFLAMCLLLYIARRISTMEAEIHALSLRDELTGLHNLRGFRILAEQALRMARRSHVPFSLLFLDLDNLKEINDSFGHAAGSRMLSDTGDILVATFRESDVLGRIGGDEFAVAGQFSHAAITVAIHRLRDAVLQRNQHTAKVPFLSLSLGHITTEPDDEDTLDELLEKADLAMYQEKRIKKPRPA
jgi:diguanylate cyclase (GGDEF)-like protein